MESLSTVIAVLYAVSMTVLLVYGLNLLWLSVRHAWTDRLLPGPVPSHEALPAFDGVWPPVTVQLPLYNEATVAERLIDACAALDYPRRLLEIQVLDDSTDDTADLVARRVAYWRARGLDIVQIRRADRQGFKAGALQNGLNIARGDLVAIFDADFIPPTNFLRRMVPHFDAPDIGLVQARWGHLNGDESLLTRLQGFGLDTHFALEQPTRNRSGCFINFNGTAGIFRRACIEDTGGWHGDTLTEDLDLSYRAQMRGWRFRYLTDIEVPAELPPDLAALRTQQFRWSKGAFETAIKLIRSLWRSRQPLHVKLEGSLHLTAHLAFPFTLLAGLLHVPLLVGKHTGAGPGGVYFGMLNLGLIGLAGFFLAQLFAQRRLYPDWPRRMRLFPLFMAGSIGLAVSNTRAVWQAARGRRSAFVRTPKFSGGSAARYRSRRVPPIAWVEGLLALYSTAGVGVLLYYNEWVALPFQAVLALGFGMLTTANLRAAFGVDEAVVPA